MSKPVQKVSRGFTLIELLVVIAIIGILSAIVMASLSTARAKGADAAIKSNLAQLRSQSEMYMDENKSYGPDTADCADTASMFASTTMQNILAEASRVSNASTTCYVDDGDSAAGLEGTSWAVSVPLKTNPALSWCVDNTGAATTAAATLDANNVAVCQ